MRVAVALSRGTEYRRDPALVDKIAGSAETKFGNAALPSPFFKAPSMNLHVPPKIPPLQMKPSTSKAAVEVAVQVEPMANDQESEGKKDDNGKKNDSSGKNHKGKCKKRYGWCKKCEGAADQQVNSNNDDNDGQSSVRMRHHVIYGISLNLQLNI